MKKFYYADSFLYETRSRIKAIDTYFHFNNGIVLRKNMLIDSDGHLVSLVWDMYSPALGIPDNLTFVPVTPKEAVQHIKIYG